MTAHSIVTTLVYIAFAYSIYSGIKSIRTMDTCRSGPRCAAVLITVIGMLYLVEGVILFFKGDLIEVHPIAALVSILSVAVNLIAIKIFIKESTHECIKSKFGANQELGEVQVKSIP